MMKKMQNSFIRQEIISVENMIKIEILLAS